VEGREKGKERNNNNNNQSFRKWIENKLQDGQRQQKIQRDNKTEGKNGACVFNCFSSIIIEYLPKVAFRFGQIKKKKGGGIITGRKQITARWMAVCYLWVSSIFVLSLFPNKTVVTGKRIYYTKIIRMKGSFELNKKRERERERVKEMIIIINQINQRYL